MKYLIVGLGNIGEEYRDTRHNVGFMVIEQMAEKFSLQPEPVRHGAMIPARYKGRQLLLLMPNTYMNLSGKAVRYHLDNHKIPTERLLVITDDVALPFGQLRMKPKGSDGGHNGLKHIQEVLGTPVYPRLRIGVGNDYPKGSQAHFVLSPFPPEEQAELPNVLTRCVNGILSFATIGIGRTMNELNRK